uniref:Putative cytochrome n=2 Tax=Ixodes ricinus TaxID=34613 RepID=V5H5G9_IXORI
MSFLGWLIIPEWSIGLALLGVVIYLRATRHKNYWKNQNVPYEKLSLFFGTTLQFMRRPFHEVEEELCKKHGRLFGTFEDGRPTLYVTEPELLKYVFVKDFSSLINRRMMSFKNRLMRSMIIFSPLENWRRLRNTSSPAFTTGKLRKMNDMIQECAKLTAVHMKNTAESKSDENIKKIYTLYALKVISSCAFGVDVEGKKEEMRTIVNNSENPFFTRITFPIALQVLFQNFIGVLHVKRFNEKAFEFFREVSQRIIEARRKSQCKYEDLLQMNLDAQETQVGEITHNNVKNKEPLFHADSDSNPRAQLSSHGLTEDEVLSQCIIMFLAGLDTSSSVATYTTYLLALNPDVQERLRREVDECFEKHGDSLTYDIVSKLDYLNAVVCEGLRMFPPGSRLERTPHENYVLGDTGILIPKGSTIVIPVYALHHDSEFYPDPYTFNPDRFTAANIDSIHPYAFLPFGTGPRNCLGRRLALQSVKMALLYALRSVKFVQTPKTKVPLEFYNGYGVMSVKDITVGICSRDS